MSEKQLTREMAYGPGPGPRFCLHRTNRAPVYMVKTINCDCVRTSNMPEGPELFKNSQFVNSVCKGRIFYGKIVKSSVNIKNPEVHFPVCEYTICSESRGKEMALIINPQVHRDKQKRKTEKKCGHKRLRILFRFGMSGKFTFGPATDIHKHAHLNFYTKEKPVMVLSFVDVRRFGRWEVSDSWSKNRGPDPMFEYSKFRSNVIDNLDEKIFDKPLCEVMHNQKYFNGIGNYLRAEIIFRAGIPPFNSARSVLAKLKVHQEAIFKNTEVQPDILELCNTVPKEVINLPGKGYNPSGSSSDYSVFTSWLQCYYNPEMRNIIDHDGRTMWFKGEAGSLVPKEAKSRGVQNSRKRKHEKLEGKEDNGIDHEIKKESSPPKKRKLKAQQNKKDPEGEIKSSTAKKRCPGEQHRKTGKKSPIKKNPVRRSLRICGKKV